MAPEIMDNYGGYQNVQIIPRLDFGIIYKINRQLVLGGKVDDVNGSYMWKILNPCDADKKARNYQEYPLKTIKLGLAYTGYKGISIYFQEDIINISGNNINYRSRLGMEYRLPSKIKLRFGFEQAQGELTSDEEKNSINIKPTLGAGVPIEVWKKQNIQMDYALDPGNVGEGLSHLFSFSIQLK